MGVFVTTKQQPMKGLGTFESSATIGGKTVNIDPRIVDIMQQAAAASPYNVVAFSGVQGRSAGTQNHPGGYALDVYLQDPKTGQLLTNYGGSAFTRQGSYQENFPAYEQFAQTARIVQQQKYPALDNTFRWGGYFFAGSGNSSPDLMHFDITPRMNGAMGGGTWDKGATANFMKTYGLSSNGGLDANPDFTNQVMQDLNHPVPPANIPGQTPLTEAQRNAILAVPSSPPAGPGYNAVTDAQRTAIAALPASRSTPPLDWQQAFSNTPSPALGSTNSQFPALDAGYNLSTLTPDSGALSALSRNMSGSPDDRDPSLSTPYVPAPYGRSALTESQRNAMLAMPPSIADLHAILNAEPAQPTGATIPDPTFGNTPYTATFPPANTILGGMSKQTPPAALQGAANTLSGIAGWLAPPPAPSAPAAPSFSGLGADSPVTSSNLPPLSAPRSTGSNSLSEALRNAILAVPSTPVPAGYNHVTDAQRTAMDAIPHISGNIPTTSYLAGTVQLPPDVRPSTSNNSSGGNDASSWYQPYVSSSASSPPPTPSTNWADSYYSAPPPVASSVPTTRQVTQQVQQINPAYTAWMNNQTPAPSPFSNPGVQGLSPDDRDSADGIARAVPGLTSSAFSTPAPSRYITVPRLVTVPVPGAAPVVPLDPGSDYLAYLRQQAENPLQQFYNSTPLGHITGFLGGLFNPMTGTYGAPRPTGLLGWLSGAMGSQPSSSGGSPGPSLAANMANIQAAQSPYSHDHSIATGGMGSLVGGLNNE